MTQEIKSRIKVSDLIADFVSDKGIKFVHFLAGGGAATLQDSLCKHSKLQYISYASESGASYAAFGESKLTNKLSLLSVTSGIGGICALSGVLSAWNDSVPMLILSGNVNFNQTARYYKLHKNLNLRQVGIQDNDIIEVVKNITKYSKTIENAEDILFELGKAYFLATSGRPSPVWLEIPSNVANTFVNIDDLKRYDYSDIPIDQRNNFDPINRLKQDLLSYQRPLVLAGGGIRQSNTVKQFREFIEKYQLPYVNSFLGCDLMDFDSPYNLGCIGVKPRRNANFALQNCNLLLVLGCQLNICHIGYLADKFAYKAKKIAVDIDPDIHKKGLVKIDETIICDLGEFFAICR